MYVYGAGGAAGVRVQGQVFGGWRVPFGSGSLPSSCGSQELNSGHQAWQQATLPHFSEWQNFFSWITPRPFSGDTKHGFILSSLHIPTEMREPERQPEFLKVCFLMITNHPKACYVICKTQVLTEPTRGAGTGVWIKRDKEELWGHERPYLPFPPCLWISLSINTLLISMAWCNI